METQVGTQPQVESRAEAKEYQKLLQYIKMREQNLSRYSDKLRQTLNTLNAILRDDIKISIEVDDTEPFRVEKIEEDSGDIVEYKYYLAIQDHRLIVRVHRDSAFYKEKWDWFGIANASRETLKCIIKSGRLLKFLQYVAENLEKTTKEYEAVATIAEKIAQAVSTQ